MFILNGFDKDAKYPSKVFIFFSFFIKIKHDNSTLDIKHRVFT